MSGTTILLCVTDHNALQCAEDYWSCAGGLSVVNAIGIQLRDGINTGLTQGVDGICGRRRGKREESRE